MSAKHTPGPWKVRKHWFDGGAYEVYPSRGRKPDVGTWAAIAEVTDYVSKNESARANARLIAAAPELLSALIQLRKAIKSVEPVETSLVVIENVLDAMKSADAVIAKATGCKSNDNNPD